MKSSQITSMFRTMLVLIILTIAGMKALMKALRRNTILDDWHPNALEVASNFFLTHN